MRVGQESSFVAANVAANSQQSQAEHATPSTSASEAPTIDKETQKADQRKRAVAERESATRRLNLGSPPPSPTRTEGERQAVPQFDIPDIVIHLAEDSPEVETPAQRAAERKKAEWENVDRKTSSAAETVALKKHFSQLSPDELNIVFGKAAGDQLRKVSTNVNYDAVRFDNHYGERVWMLSHNVRHPHFPIRMHEIVGYQAAKAGADSKKLQYLVGQHIAAPEVRKLLAQSGFKHMDVLPANVLDHFAENTALAKAAKKLLDDADKKIVSVRLLMEDEKEMVFSLVLGLENRVPEAAQHSPS